MYIYIQYISWLLGGFTEISFWCVPLPIQVETAGFRGYVDCEGRYGLPRWLVSGKSFENEKWTWILYKTYMVSNEHILEWFGNLYSYYSYRLYIYIAIYHQLQGKYWNYATYLWEWITTNSLTSQQGRIFHVMILVDLLTLAKVIKCPIWNDLKICLMPVGQWILYPSFPNFYPNSI